MTQQMIETCPGCLANLPSIDGPTHRYIGASPACWALFTTLVNGGEPPLAPSPWNGLIGDAYAAQHPGMSSPQAIQSVAVHLLTLYGVLRAGVVPTNALWVRQRALRRRAPPGAADGFTWLTPPAFAETLTVADIVHAPTPDARAKLAQHYIEEVFQRWQAIHAATIARWYDRFVLYD